MKKFEKQLPDILHNFDRNIKFASHRGSGKLGDIPENTLSAFRYSLKKGFKINELDIRLSKDGVPVVFHGPNLNKTTSGNGFLENYDYEDLKKLDWGSYIYRSHKPNQKHTPILSLDEYFSEFGAKCYTNIELKKSFFDFKIKLEKQTINLIKKYGLEKRVFISSFNYFSLLNLKKLASDFPRGLLIRSDYINERFLNMLLKMIKPSSIHIHSKILNKQKIKKWKEQGYYLVTWGENSQQKLKFFFECGVDLAIIDDLNLPKKFLSIS